jgi:uracil-DNA glycosylase
MSEFCPGYVKEPFRTLATTYPDETAYPQKDFRTEWGPIFHRGRLDGTARLLMIGQDPGQHENVLRRILSGEAGRRVQGFAAKLGITRSYVNLNALLYSVYGSGGSKYVTKPGVADHRNQWIDGILASKKVEAVVTFGGMAKDAWNNYASGHPVAASLTVKNLTHPTFPESAGGTAAQKKANTKKMLTEWNGALPALHAAMAHKDVSTPLALYGDAFVPADKADIPSFDLPAGIPAWMYDDDGWAKRAGATAADKRANITITVPASALP